MTSTTRRIVSPKLLARVPSGGAEPLPLNTWRRALGVLVLGAAITAVMDRLLFAGETRVGDLRGLHLAWSVAVTLAAAAAACLVWPRRERELGALPEPELLRAQRRLLAHSFARSLAHDGNNILLGLRFRIAELARLQQESMQASDARQDEVPELIHELGRSCDEIEVLLGRLRELGQQNGRIVLSAIRLDEALPRILETANGHAAVRVAAPELLLDAGLVVTADPSLLRQMLINLLLNAVQASGHGGQVKLCARQGLEHVIVEVHDSGPGLPESSDGEEQIQPFRSDRPEGTGLGLWAARACAESMGGGLQFDRSDLGGLCVRISLPEGTDPATS